MEETQQKSIPELIEQLYDVVSVQLWKLRFDRCIHELKQLQRRPISIMDVETADTNSKVKEASLDNNQTHNISETKSTPQEQGIGCIMVEDLGIRGKQKQLSLEIVESLGLLKYGETCFSMVGTAQRIQKDNQILQVCQVFDICSNESVVELTLETNRDDLFYCTTMMDEFSDWKGGTKFQGFGVDIKHLISCSLLGRGRYNSKREELYGRVMERSGVVYFVDGIGNQRNPDEAYDFDFKNESHAVIQDKPLAIKKYNKYELMADERWQNSFVYQVDRANTRNDIIFPEVVTRYKGFLHLIKRRKGTYLQRFCAPTYDADLIWHRHQLFLVFHCQDLEAAIGKVWEHDYTENIIKEEQLFASGGPIILAHEYVMEVIAGKTVLLETPNKSSKSSIRSPSLSPTRMLCVKDEANFGTPENRKTLENSNDFDPNSESLSPPYSGFTLPGRVYDETDRHVQFPSLTSGSMPAGRLIGKTPSPGISIGLGANMKVTSLFFLNTTLKKGVDMNLIQSPRILNVSDSAACSSPEYCVRTTPKMSFRVLHHDMSLNTMISGVLKQNVSVPSPALLLLSRSFVLQSTPMELPPTSLVGAISGCEMVSDTLRSALQSPKPENRVLDPKSTLNIAIFLKALDVTIEGICEVLSEGNPDTFGTELQENILKEYNDKSPTEFGQSGKFLMAVLNVPFVLKPSNVKNTAARDSAVLEKGKQDGLGTPMAQDGSHWSIRMRIYELMGCSNKEASD